jgi:anhydro-N-acetylmuramic acid kinase
MTRDGAWAARAQVSVSLLADNAGTHPYFAQPPPKSTGRDLFNRAWLDSRAGAHFATARPVDVQATLAELTARSCAESAAAPWAA